MNDKTEARIVIPSKRKKPVPDPAERPWGYHVRISRQAYEVIDRLSYESGLSLTKVASLVLEQAGPMCQVVRGGDSS